MRYAHTMLRVSDLERSKLFYHNALGLKLLREKEYPDGAFTLSFLGFSDETKETVLELTYNWDGRGYELGTYFGHLAFWVDDLEQAYQKAIAAGAGEKVPPKTFGAGTRLAFVTDPDGYEIEFIEHKLPAT